MPDITELMLSAGWWESAGYFTSCIVVIGIILESVDLFRLAFRGELGSKWLEATAAIIIVLGLAGELLTAAISNNRTGLIIGALNAEAKEATKQSAIANDHAAELQLALQKEIAARQPRLITEEQKSALIAYWKDLDKGPVIVSAKAFDEEAQQFSKQIIDVLNASGFDAKKGADPMSFTVSGQWIVVRHLDQFTKKPTYVGNVQKGFKNILNIDFDGRQMDSSYPAELGDVVIAIGSKL